MQYSKHRKKQVSCSSYLCLRIKLWYHLFAANAENTRRDTLSLNDLLTFVRWIQRMQIRIILMLSITFYCSSEINSDVSRVKAKNDFDLLIFTQRWPITDCMTWMNRGEDHVCMLPSQKDTWVIHGIWPTKLGKLGPFFCNSSSPFDINTLEPLMDQLKQYWINIEKG